MPLPLILGIGAAIAGAAGVGAGIHGGVKMKEASDKSKEAQERHQRNQARFTEMQETTTTAMDQLGELELQILDSFSDFADAIEAIQNRPQFNEISIGGVTLPEYRPETLKDTSVGAAVLLGGLGGAAVGTAGGFAAAGATTAAVMALGTASTGTAIASLSGAAATNATLAALGGGAIAAGGGGMALGTMVLGGATLGVGLLVGGIIFSISGSKVSDQADQAWSQMLQAEKEINRICEYLGELYDTATSYSSVLQRLKIRYDAQLARMKEMVFTKNRTNWKRYTEQEKLLVQNTSMLVGVLYEMCKVKIVVQSSSSIELNTINYYDIEETTERAEQVLQLRMSA